MLEEILSYLHNFFFTGEVISGPMEISDGTVTIPWVKDGQFFQLTGSTFNDGVHQYPVSGLIDETFDGTVKPMAVPAELLSMVSDIEAWNEKYPATPYNSESFGGYSYSRSTGATSAASSWTDAFAKRLRRWKKL